MPLFKGKSKKTFGKNVETEMDAGKPQKQALAIAYAMKKKSKKMAHGGGIGEESKERGVNSPSYSSGRIGEKGNSEAGEAVRRAAYGNKEENYKFAKDKNTLASRELKTHKTGYFADGGEIESAMHGEQSDAHECEMCGGKGCPSCNEEMEHDRHDDAGEPMMAEGGQITDNYNSPSTAMHQTHDGEVDPESGYFPEHEGDHKRPNSRAMSEDSRGLNQHGAHEEGPQGTWMAEGGQITDNEQSDAHMLDMVGRIMAQRQQMYSKGGQVANNTDKGWETGERRDDMGSGQYDDLVIRDNDMEDADYTGENSGDSTSDARENKDRKDIVGRIIKDRKMKSSMDGMSGYGRSDRALKQKR